MTYFYVFIGGGLGCLARFSIAQLVSYLIHSPFPFGTFLSNLFACILLVLIVVGARDYSSGHAWIQPLLILGFCGGFSTFSAFSFETVQLFNNGNITLAILNIVLSLSTGMGAILLLQPKG